MTQRPRRILLLAVVPTLVDIGLLVFFRQGLGWILVVANATAIAVASVLSYLLHSSVTFRSDPYVRWVRFPAAFVVVALLAGTLDVLVLRVLFAAHGFETTGGLVAAKLVSLSMAGLLRLFLYRAVLLGAVRRALQQQVPRPPAPGQMRATVIIPALGEATRIGGTIGAIRAALAPIGADGGLEIIVVDDGSQDGTADAALVGGADQVLVLPENRGKGAAIRAGVAVARGRAIAFTDADLAYSPDQLGNVLREVEAGWDVAVGSRRHPDTVVEDGAGWLRGVGSRAVNLLAMGVLLSHPHDTQCGLKGFRSDVAKTIVSVARVDRFAFDIELLHLVERFGFSLIEVPVHLGSPEHSTVQLVRDTARLIRDIWRIRRWSAAGVYELPSGVLESSVA
ncbi:MAG: glycosyltransferase [Acidimicrobiia bacterium]|nr:glycosyltransferase [Acidimicrobiia bacterium]